ncbi:Rid family detoxifying hydrolase [Candidatus Bathyarchaeota archaeon]|nr:Rid family detoxifying hydrolase [Candidatus Bathyarchaeota archaeon]MBS7629839.1 Rid family detoxifying hydrolase [Candidatus Bathyarchaeota archaeon]
MQVNLLVKNIIRTDKAPIPVAPYSQAVEAGGVIYVSGFVAFDPKTGKVVPGGIKEQATQVMENIKAVLEAAGSSMRDVVKTNVYLTDMKDFAGMNEVFKQYFPTEPPARVTVGVKLPLPELLIEIDAIAVPNP